MPVSQVDWMLDAIQAQFLACRAYGWVETAQHLLQSHPLVLKVRFESIKEHGNIVKVAIFLHLILRGLAEATLVRIAGLQHLHASVELEAQEGGRPLLSFQPVGRDLLLHLSAFLNQPLRIQLAPK